MDWIKTLIFDNSSIAHIVFIYAAVIALGVRLGKFKIFGISLGVTFVLFVGIVAGHFKLGVESEILHFIREFGLILFIFSIGMQVGPGFFSSFRQGGLLLNKLALLIVCLNVAVMLTIFYLDNGSATDLIGVLSGAVTNTPGLGAAQQTLIDVNGSTPNIQDAIEAMSMGYAAAYPLGVLGIILTMLLVKYIFNIKLDKENEAVEAERENSQLKPYVITVEVTNPLIEGITLRKFHDLIEKNFVVSRIKTKSGNVIIPKSDSELHKGDLLLMVISVQDEDTFTSFIGPKVDLDWNATPGQLVSRRILVTKSDINGHNIGSLRLRMGYNLNATRVNRAGVELLADPNLKLQVGDRITVVGELDDINRLASRLGNSMKRLNEPNMVTTFVCILLGILLGSIPFSIPGMSVPMKLGLAGGPLIVAILISRWGYKIGLVTYTSSSANLLMRELGICLFLASVGLASGEKFVATVFNATGAMWVLYGFIITLVPLIIVAILARSRFKLNYFTIMGLLSGSYTDPPALAYANKIAGGDTPAVAYSTVYPLTMFLRVISAQILVLLLV